MSPQEQAKKIYSDMEDSINGLEGDEWYESAKQCAITCVEQIIKSRPLQPMNWDKNNVPMPQIEWWKQVKEELLKL